ncbi:MAG: DUF481 domain-containing protein [Pirellulaceae bacterium]
MKQLTASLFALFVLACQPLVAQDILVAEEVFEGVIVESPVWDGSFAFGLNGKSGNSENYDMNLTFDAKKDGEFAITEFLLTYFYSTNDIATTVDRLYTEARQERKLQNPNFTWYYSGFFERDRFRNFDYRIGAHTGIGILLYEFDDRFLKSRIGAGASREVGGLDDDWKPELQLGLDWERYLTARTKLFATVDAFPNVQDFSDYRVNTRAGVETLLDKALDMRLRAFIFNRYDSTPEPGDGSNDLDYGLSLAFGF